MLPPVVQKGIGNVVSNVAKHGSKIILSLITATGVLIAEEYRKYKAIREARREGEAAGFSNGYNKAKEEDRVEVERSRQFLEKISKKKGK
mgnify:CR=1 FL=1